MELNRQGCTRVVLLTKRYAIKFPALINWRLFLQGLLGNMQEANFSRNCDWPELCPVVFACPGGWLIVMRRAEPLTRPEYFALDYAQWVKGGKPLPDGGWLIPVENKISSFGKLDGRIVAIDYGS